MHARREKESLEMHRRIADKLRHNPEPILRKASENLHRWLARQDGEALAGVWREWLDILSHTPPQQLASWLVSDDSRAQRLRQSSPFAGVLPPQEIWQIKRDHAATRT